MEAYSKAQSKLWMRVGQGMLQLLNSTTMVIFLFLTSSLCLFNNGLVNNSKAVPFVVLFLLVCGVIIVQKIEAKSIALFLKKSYYPILLSATLLVFCVQVYIVSRLNTNIGWDVARIMQAAQAVDLRPHDAYFSLYPNNLLLFFIYRALIVAFTKFGVTEIWLGFSVLNAAMVTISVFLASEAGKNMKGKQSGYIAWILSVLVFGFFPWLIIPYSDTLSMPFTIGIFYLYTILKKSDNLKRKWVLATLMGFVTGVAYLLKPTNSIVFIAVVLISIVFHLGKWSSLKKECAYLLAAIGCIVLVNSIFSIFVEKQNMLQINPEQKATPLSFMMLGTSKVVYEDGYTLYGTWNETDAEIIQNSKAKEELNEQSKQAIKDRINGMGPVGYLNFLQNKARWIFSDGTFFWGQEGNFANFKELSPSIVKEFYAPTGGLYKVFQTVSYGIWCGILLLLVFPLLSLRKYWVEPQLSVLRCSILGILIFLLFFEGRSRYLIPYLPIFTILASHGFFVAKENIEKHIRNIKNADKQVIQK